MDIVKLRQYITNPAFRKADHGLLQTPWHRPLVFSEHTLDHAKKLNNFADIATSNGYLLNKVLFNIYEQQTIFLSDKKIDEKNRHEFVTYYDAKNIATGLELRSHFESAVFDFLFADIKKINWFVVLLLDAF